MQETTPPTPPTETDLPSYYRGLPPDALRSPSRIEGEPFEQYKQRQKQLKAMDKQQRGGRWLHISSAVVTKQTEDGKKEEPYRSTYVKPKEA